MKISNLKTILLSLVVMALWGSLFPCIKLGYEAFAIDSANIPDIIMFAGMRFVLCGGIVTLIALIKRDKIAAPKPKNIGIILLVGLFAIVLHYACTYVGLGVTDGSKTAILKQLGALFYVCFAFLFIKNEKFSIYKIFGALVGFAGIIAINLSSVGFDFAWGDILIIGASLCTVASGIFTKKIADNNSPFWITGLSQLAGGIVLVVAAVIMGGSFLTFSIEATLIFAYICTASTVAYLLWNYILKTADLSNMFIIKFAEPLFACLFSAALLGEDIFKLQYLAAFLLISAGIVLGNKTAEKQHKS